MHHTAAHSQGGDGSVATKGRVIHWARQYDLLVRLLSFGRIGRLRHRLVRAGRIGSGSDVLDVGCGTGDLTMQAWKATVPGGSVTGIDPSSEMVEVAREKADKAGNGARFQAAAIEALPFADGSFDTVLSSLMMHHLPDDVRAAGLAEVARVLRPGGTLAAVDFRPAESRSDRLMAHLRFHGRHSVTHDLATEFATAGLRDVRTIDARMMGLSFFVGRKPAD